MKPLGAPEDGTLATGTTAPAVCLCPPYPLQTLRKRPDFLATARSKRQATPAFTLQARQRRADEPATPLIRIGFTASKKIGNAVARNRAKRRLREVARATLPVNGQPGWDYVLIARPEATVKHPFADLSRDILRALAKIHQNPRRNPVKD